MAFDIECLSSIAGAFPDASRLEDRIVMISCVVQQPPSQPVVRRVFVMGKRHEEAEDDEPQEEDHCIQAVGNDERAMLMAWARFVRDRDVDVLLGYNSSEFDLPYVMQRARVLGIQLAFRRVLSWRLWLPEDDDAHGEEEAAAATTTRHDFSGSRPTPFLPPGVLHIDVLAWLRRFMYAQVRSFSLDAVSRQLLNTDDDNNTTTTVGKVTLTEGVVRLVAESIHCSSARRRLARYCLRDSDLVHRLAGRLRVITSVLELSALAHVLPNDVLAHGQSHLVYNLVCMEARVRGMVVPDRRGIQLAANQPPQPQQQQHLPQPAVGQREWEEERGKNTPHPPCTASAGKGSSTKGGGAGYRGALVLDPVVGAHMDTAVACLDFASLYPSIIMAHNLCYTTILMDDSVSPQQPTATRHPHWPPIKQFGPARFADTQQVGCGGAPPLLPSILARLASKRQEAKVALAAVVVLQQRDVLEARQAAIKIIMNSVYGVCGAPHSQLPCVALAAAVTAVGRDMILRTSEVIPLMYQGARILYGDTDSVMVDFGQAEVAATCEMGQQAAARVSQLFPPPVRLCFEKCYRPFLLLSKKRYAGLAFESGASVGRIDIKGLQLVRHDTCTFVRQTMHAVLEELLFRSDVQGALRVAGQGCEDLLAGRVPVNDLAVTKRLKASVKELCATPGRAQELYKNPHVLPHVVAALRHQPEDPHSTRQSYVILSKRHNNTSGQQTTQATRLSSRAVAPQVVRGDVTLLDLEYYLSSVLEPQLTEVFSLFIMHAPSPQEHPVFAPQGWRGPAVVRLLRELQEKTTRQPAITRFFLPSTRPQPPQPDGCM
jgi:DNA polymerase delta subunit 1